MQICVLEVTFKSVFIFLFVVKNRMAANLLTLTGGESTGVAFSATFTILGISILIAAIVHFYYRSTEAFKLAIQIPGPDPIPLLGNALMAVGKNSNGK